MEKKSGVNFRKNLSIYGGKIEKRSVGILKRTFDILR